MGKQTASLQYGSSRLTLNLPHLYSDLSLTKIAEKISPERFAKKLGDQLTNSQFDLSAPILIIADKTRLCGYPEYLPVLIRQLEQYGMNKGALRCIIAYGTHPPQSDEESLLAYGRMFHELSFIHHNCHQKGLFDDLGKTSRGTPIRFRKDLSKASTIITFGAISHHYFAGFGGGRKLIFPGCGEREAIYKNHSLYLDQKTKQLAAGCEPGCIHGNPLAEDLDEISTFLPAHIAIHGILDEHGKVCDLIIGRPQSSFEAACMLHAQNCEIATGQFDIVIASCGGFPKDINFIQSHKAIHNSAMFVKDGGTLIAVAECKDGIGSTTFLPWFDHNRFEDLFTALSADYQGNGGTALSMKNKTRRIRIILISSLNRELCRAIDVEKKSLEEVNSWLLTQPKDSTLAVIANASIQVKKRAVK